LLPPHPVFEPGVCFKLKGRKMKVSFVLQEKNCLL